MADGRLTSGAWAWASAEARLRRLPGLGDAGVAGSLGSTVSVLLMLLV